MSRLPTSDRVTTALFVVGVGLLLLPALVPVQPMLYHYTGGDATRNASELREDGHRIVAYENLSERGQQLYVETLRNGGEYAVPLGEGAEDFRYPTAGELGDVEDWDERNRLLVLVVERPLDADLPPPDEPVEYAEEIKEDREEQRRERREERGIAGNGTAANGTDDGPTVEELRRQIGRYDQMSTRTQRPRITSTGSLLRLLSVALGVVALSTGGYLRSQP